MNAEMTNMLMIDRVARHLLVLCQDLNSAKHLEGALRTEDYQATIVRNPRQAALAVLNQRHIDAIICDGQMNLGREEERVFHQIRHNLGAFNIPLLMLLDPDDEAQWQLAEKLAIDEFVLKPTREEELLLRLKGLLWRKEINAVRPSGQQWPERLQSFTRYVKTDLEARFEAGGSASLALIEVTGGWDLMVRGDERCDQLTDQLFDYLSTNLRRIDRVVRYGRVTLIVYLPARAAGLACEALELLRAEFSDQTGLDFCFGLATYMDDGAHFNELILSADYALTQARVRGRNSLAQGLNETNGRYSGTHKVLIAADDPFIVALLKATLHAWGYESLVVDNAGDAIEWIDREQPDLLLLDHLMPELSEFTLLEQLQSHFGGRFPVPVVMLAIMTGQNDIIRGYELGVEDYIGKPFTPRELIARIERVLASRPSFLRTGP